MVSIYHSKTSLIPDDPNTDLVRSSDWNASHVIAPLSTTSLLLGTSSTSTAVAEIILGTNLTMSGNTLNGPSLTGYVPYIGATTDVNLGAHFLAARQVFADQLFSDAIYAGLATPGTLASYTTGGLLQSAAIGSHLSFSGNTLSVIGADLTRVNDTNVTLTLGGTPVGSLLNAVSLTLGWTGSLSIARGGTNNTSYSNYGILYYDGTKITSSSDFTAQLFTGPGGFSQLYLNFGIYSNLLVYAADTGISQQMSFLGNATVEWGISASGAALGTLTAHDFIFERNAAEKLRLNSGGIAITGNVSSGTWQATKIGLAYGGTNADLSATGGAGQYLKQTSAGAAITVGTIPASEIVSGAALTRTNDTNVTLTLGGSPTTALLAATSLTLGWTGTLAATRGGTGFGTYTVGDILYADTTTTLAKLADVATGSVLTSGGVGVAPAWTTLSSIAVTSVTGVSGRTVAFPTTGAVIVDISASYTGQATITTVGTLSGGIWQATTIAAGYGGTGIASYAVGDLLYASGTTTLAKLADVATGNVLLSGGVGVAPSWGKVSMTAAVSGVLPIPNGGTNAASQVTNGVCYFDGTKITSSSLFTYTSGALLAANVGTDRNLNLIPATTQLPGSAGICLRSINDFGDTFMPLVLNGSVLKYSYGITQEQFSFGLLENHILNGTSIGTSYYAVSPPTDGLIVAGKAGFGTSSPLSVSSVHINGALAYSARNANPLSAQLLITNTAGGRLYIGDYYTAGVGTAATIQASDYFSSVDNGAALLLNPLGGAITIGGGTNTTSVSIYHDVSGPLILNRNSSNYYGNYLSFQFQGSEKFRAGFNAYNPASSDYNYSIYDSGAGVARVIIDSAGRTNFYNNSSTAPTEITFSNGAYDSTTYQRIGVGNSSFPYRFYLTQNATQSGANWVGITNGFGGLATKYEIFQGAHTFSYASSVTGGGTITWKDLFYVGTSAGYANLIAKEASGAYFQLVNSTSGYATVLAMDGTATFLYNNANGYTYIRSYSTGGAFQSQVIIHPNGSNLGINCGYAYAKLSICGAAADNQTIEMGYSGGLSANYMENINRNGGAGVDFAFYVSDAHAWKWYTSASLRMRLDAGLQVGAPTGGDKGAGTINVAGDIYKNNTAYNNPDYVAEHYYTGKITLFAKNPGAAEYKGLMPLSVLDDYMRKHYRLPGITDIALGVFGRQDFLLEKTEELFLHTIRLEKENKELRVANDNLAKRVARLEKHAA